MNYFFHLGIMLEIYILLAVAYNFVLGYAGMLSLCQAMYYGLGAYSAALLGIHLRLSFVVILPSAMLIAGCAGWVVSLLARRLRDLYFGLATLAVQIIFFSVAYNWEWATKGPYGITDIPNPDFIVAKVESVPSFFVLGGVLLVASLLFSRWFQRTPVCRIMRCVRDDQVAITSLGKNPERYKALASVIGAAMSGAAGVLYAMYITYIDPTSFTLDGSILILSILMVGGSGNLTGPVAGAVFYTFVPEILKVLHLSDSVAANLRLIIFGGLLILVIRFRPNGFFGTFQIR